MASFKKEDWTSLFWTILLICFIRAFMVEPFKIPSGSMIPTLLVGDHLFVAKASYDIGIPLTDIKLIHVSDPKRGDVVVFEYPNHEKDPTKDGQYYIKRIIGVPGDQIQVKAGVPYINGSKVDQELLEAGPSPKQIPDFNFDPKHQVFNELLPGMTRPHWVQRYPSRLKILPEAVEELKSQQNGATCIGVGTAFSGELHFYDSLLLNEVCPFTVPAGQYFMMGDNRDDSADGREWGFVERKLLKGRALFIWFSIFHGNGENDSIPITSWRLLWNRFGLGIH